MSVPADILIASEDNCHPWIFDKLMVSDLTITMEC